MKHEFTDEQHEFLKDNIKGRKVELLTDMFNERFGLSVRPSQIRAFAKNRGLKSGLDFRFKRGHVPANKGKKGTGGWEPTQFKKGHKPHNYVPVGTERINTYGYTDIKVAEPSRWRGKHLILWEEHYGPIPAGHVVMFGDGNKLNLDINNLILVTRAQMATLNKKKLIQNDADLTRTAVLIADISHFMYKREKESKAKRKG